MTRFLWILRNLNGARGCWSHGLSYPIWCHYHITLKNRYHCLLAPKKIPAVHDKKVTQYYSALLLLQTYLRCHYLFWRLAAGDFRHRLWTSRYSRDDKEWSGL